MVNIDHISKAKNCKNLKTDFSFVSKQCATIWIQNKNDSFCGEGGREEGWGGDSHVINWEKSNT